MDKSLVDYLRITSCLQIERASSGHPGIALSGAPLVYSIYKNAFVLPEKPKFFNRDRIVISAGHASALIYSCLHLFGYDVTLTDLKNFRKLGSITTGHPEVNVTPGIDATTGPLGQGIGMAVGMAICEEFLRNTFNRDNFSPINHYTYCFCGDGCLMEGVGQEAVSLAGNLKLNKLILLYDKNDITIEGSTSITNNENVKEKFLASNWNVLEVKDGNNVLQIDKAIKKAKLSSKPTIIICKTKIGYGSPLEGKNTVHGKPLNKEQIDILRKNLKYFVPNWITTREQRDYIESLRQIKRNEYKDYKYKLNIYKEKYPSEYKKLIRSYKDINLKNLFELQSFDKFDARNAIHLIMNKLYKIVPTLIGGSADLSPSTRTNFYSCGLFSALNRENRNIAYGVREHAMGAISNGISLHGGALSFCSTFFAFENYLSPAIRLSALMNNPVLYIFTHDSISVGEDGPTHQPVEQIALLRAMPNLNVFRPCSYNELLFSINYFFTSKQPCVIVLPRQVIMKIDDSFEESSKGGYFIKQNKKSVTTIVSTGTDVEIALNVAKILDEKGIITNVVSMPCVELFDKQDKSYKDKILDKQKDIFCIETSSDNVWYKFATSSQNVFILNRFGISASDKEVLDYFGFTPQKIADKIIKILKNNNVKVGSK